MTSRWALVAVATLLGLVLLALVVVMTPWRPLGGAAIEPTQPMLDFTKQQLAREDAYHAAVRPPGYASLAVSFAVALVLGLTPLGARLVERVAAPLGGGWVWQVLLGTVALTLVGRLLVMPWDAWAETVRRRYGLSTRSWGGWLADVAKGYGIGLVLTVIVLLVVVGLARWSPQWWWALGAAIGAVLVAVVSFAYPVVVEPVFNKFEPLPAGQLRTSLLALAEADDVPVEDVLVADASRRTSALNAYVSGLGATRRIVVYDTLLDSASDQEIELIVAHELGHVKNRDLMWGTLMGATAVALAVCALARLGRWGWLLDRASVPSLGDGRSVALTLAVLAVLGLLSGPAQSFVSRRIETRADVHSLELTGEPAAMIEMQKRLSVRNLSDLDPSPLVFGLFATHPTAPQRTALARTWARLNQVAVPSSTVEAPP